MAKAGPRRRPTTSLPDDLSTEDALQVAGLVSRYIDGMQRNGRAPSPGLLALSEAMSAKAMERHSVPKVEDPRDSGDGRAVQPLLMTYGEAAALSGWSLRTVNRRVADGTFNPVRHLGQPRIRRTDIESLINADGRSHQ